MRAAVRIAAALAVLGLAALAGCVSHEYEITTSDGGKYLTEDMPVYVAGTNTYLFTDLNGTEREFKRQRIVDVKTHRLN